MAFEQNPVREVAAILGEKPNTISKRFGRALERLREILPGSVFDELEESDLEAHDEEEAK